MLNEYFNSLIHIQLCVGARVPQWNFNNLSAPHWQLFYNSGSSSAVTFQGKKIDLDPRHWVIVPPNTDFSSSSQDPFDHLFIHFTVKKPYERVKPEIFCFPTSRETQARLVALYDVSYEWPTPAGRGEIMALGLVCEALSLIPEDRLDAPIDPRVSKAITLTQKDFSNVEDNGKLAAQVGMSENAFIKLFKSQIGTSPQAYFTAKRIEIASDLLQRGTGNIQHIAAATGFCDRYHFSRVFKKVRGLSPAQFRTRTKLLEKYRLQAPPPLEE